MIVFIKGKEVKVDNVKIITQYGIELDLSEIEMVIKDKTTETDVPYSLALAL